MALGTEPVENSKEVRTSTSSASLSIAIKGLVFISKTVIILLFLLPFGTLISQNVGVDTATPGAKLMVVGAAGAPTLNVLNHGTTPTTPALRVNENGNVGLGTTAPRSKLEVSDGDVYINNSSRGIILSSPNGNCYRVTVNMQGQLTNNQVTCPN